MRSWFYFKATPNRIETLVDMSTVKRAFANTFGVDSDGDPVPDDLVSLEIHCGDDPVKPDMIVWCPPDEATAFFACLTNGEDVATWNGTPPKVDIMGHPVTPAEEVS
jgi:hypothetical protein